MFSWILNLPPPPQSRRHDRPRSSGLQFPKPPGACASPRTPETDTDGNRIRETDTDGKRTREADADGSRAGEPSHSARARIFQEKTQACGPFKDHGRPQRGILLKTMSPHTKGALFKKNVSHTKGNPFGDNGSPYKGGSFQKECVPIQRGILLETMGPHTRGGPF